MRAFLVLLSCLSLGACGIAAKVTARGDYQTSESQYKACLAANPATPQNCEGARLAMEADERKYNDLSGGINSGSQTLTILNR